MGKINDYSLFAEKTCHFLLDIYQMEDWSLSWNNFLDEATKEFKEEIEAWKDTDINAEE